MNSNHYLRGIRIDSIKVSGDSTIYYPFHTPRGAYSYDYTPGYEYITLDSSGGSWVGKQVIKKGDGTFVFDSYWHDSVIIKTQAHTGDSWILYDDSGSIYYTATVVSEDTMTILSSVDSVKVIEVNTYDTSGIATYDSLNGFKLVLSKYNGFVQLFDLYTFPYHKPDSLYRPLLDYYLDRTLCRRELINDFPDPGTPDKKTAIFSVTNFINPSEQQLYDWNIGDAFLIVDRAYTGMGSSGPEYYNVYIKDTIIGKTVSTHSIQYDVRGVYSRDYNFIVDVFPRSNTYVVNDDEYVIADSSFMPEDVYEAGGNFIFYYPDDITYCVPSPSYWWTTQKLYIGGLGGEGGATGSNKIGIGNLSFNSVWGFSTDETYYILAFNGRDRGCNPVSVRSITKPASKGVSLFPNPSTNNITLSASFEITDVSIVNTVGQTVHHSSYRNKEIVIPITNLPAGMYYARINGTTLKKFVKE